MIISNKGSGTRCSRQSQHTLPHVNMQLILFLRRKITLPFPYACICDILFHYFYSVLVSVSCPKALYHLLSDNLFRITVVVADWLGRNPYHRSSFCTVTYWMI